MAKTIAQLRTEAQTIKNETTIGANTATRVGGFGEDVVDYLEDNPPSSGAFATGEEVEDVSLFDDLNDLDGKTDEQKALMLPNGKATEELFSLIDSVIYATGYGVSGTLNIRETSLVFATGARSTWKPLEEEVTLDKLYLDPNVISAITGTGTSNIIRIVVAGSDKKTVAIYEKEWTLGDSIVDLSGMNIVVPTGGYAAVAQFKPDGTHCIYNQAGNSSFDIPRFILSETIGGSASTETGNYTSRYIFTYTKKVVKKDIIYTPGSCGTVAQRTGTPIMRGFSNWQILDEDVELTQINFYASQESDVFFQIGIASGSGNSTGWKIHTEYCYTLEAGSSIADLRDLHIVVKAHDLVVLDSLNTSLWGTLGTSSKNTPNVYFIAIASGIASRASTWGGTPYDFNYRFDYNIITVADDVLKELEEKVDTLSSGGGMVGINDMTSVLLTGSSLTYAGYTPPSYSWPERLNDLLDINLYNGGQSGSTLKGNILAVGNDAALGQGVTEKPSSMNPTYILWNNAANGTNAGALNYTVYRQAVKASRQWGAIALIGGEEPEMQGREWTGKDPDAFDQGVRGYSEQALVPAMPICGLFNKLRAVFPYKGFSSGVHGNFRSQSPYMMLADLLGKLPIKQSVKMFKVRPTYMDGSPTVEDLVYDTNEQRVKFFTAIGSGRGAAYTTGNADNLDNTNFGVGGTSAGIVSSEVINMHKGVDVAFDKFGLIEFILPNIYVNEALFKVKSSVEPTAIYVGMNATNFASTDIESDTTKMVWTSVEFTYGDDGYVTSNLQGNDLEDYDKVRILVYYDGAFNMSNPSLSFQGGREKPSVDLLNNYHFRKYGAELNSYTSVASGWTLGGSASVKSLPLLISNYPNGYNNSTSHVELYTSSDSMKKSVEIPANSNKIAVRVVAQVFPKIATNRFTSSNFRGVYYMVSTAKPVNENDHRITAVDIGQTFNIEGTNVTITSSNISSYLNWYIHLSTPEECDEVLTSGYVDGSAPVLSQFDYTYGTLVATFGNQTYLGESQQRRIVYNGWVEYYFEVDVLPTDTAIQVVLTRENAVNGLPNSDLPMMIYDVSVQKIG